MRHAKGLTSQSPDDDDSHASAADVDTVRDGHAEHDSHATSVDIDAVRD